MAAKSAIEWTDATVNFWWGCTKVGPGCDHCYAETWSKRTGGQHWGVGVPRRKIASAVKLLHRLDNGYSDWSADAECIRGNARAFGLPVPNIGNTRRVFIQSMSDLFDLEVPDEWFTEAWATIRACRRVGIQIVTKRISAVENRLSLFGNLEWPKHAGLIITVCNQQEANRDIPRLLALKSKLGIPWVGLSIEPLLGPIGLNTIIVPSPLGSNEPALGQIDWCIVGGESGARARDNAFISNARAILGQCKAAGVPFFGKQGVKKHPLPDDLMIREFPNH
jgi:protein gp37